LIRVYRGIESVASDDGLQRAAFRAGDGGGVVQLIAALFGEEWFFFSEPVCCRCCPFVVFYR
jgi:hypothetical protein